MAYVGRSVGVGEIRMDRGVGRFQAFEIATVPARAASGTASAEERTSEPVSTSEASALPTLPKSQAAHCVTGRPFSQSVRDVLAIVGTSLVMAVDAVYMRGRQRIATEVGRLVVLFSAFWHVLQADGSEYEGNDVKWAGRAGADRASARRGSFG